MPDYDVLIAGYGPTGAVAANLFGASGLKVLVVEPSRQIFDIPRAVHFDGEVMRIFQQLGLCDKLLEVAQEGNSLGFTNGRNWQLLHQDLSDIPRHNSWANNFFFNQPLLESHLRESVQQHPNVEVRLGWSVQGFVQTESAVSVDLSEDDGRKTNVSCSYLLGCDGASSIVRQCLGIGHEDLQCDEPWLVIDLKLPESIAVNRKAYQICDPNRPATLVPCEGQHIRWEFMVNADDDLADLESEESVRALMAPHLHRLSVELKPEHGELLRAKVYSFHALLADSFQQGRVFLLGDAAHQMPPFLGQGMCAGIRDAYNLHWKISGVLNGSYAADILASYTSERRPHVAEIIKTAVSHGGIIQNRSHVLSFFRDCFLLVGRIVPPLVRFLRFDLAWCLGDGILDRYENRSADNPVGQTLPQATLVVQDKHQLSDEALGPGFSIVGIGNNPADYFDAKNLDLGMQLLHIAEDGDAIDINGSFRSWAQQNDVDLAVIRPDRQVFGVLSSRADKQVELAAMLSRLRQKLGAITL